MENSCARTRVDVQAAAVVQVQADGGLTRLVGVGQESPQIHSFNINSVANQQDFLMVPCGKIKKRVRIQKGLL